MQNRRKLENIAAALPVFGAAMIFPPIVRVFAPDARLFGVPIIVIYLFAIWMMFIIATYFLSRRLKQSDVDQPGDGGSAGGNEDGVR
jgi:uncharacterized membrane protein